MIPTASLLVSELITNAVVHAGGTIMMRATFDQHTLRVEVDDGSAVLPQPREPGLNGRGLHIVTALSTKWGISRAGPRGKSTWFELRDES
jgi:anti-sigma regulatory factor (Ser/Thr protein kinase)